MKAGELMVGDWVNYRPGWIDEETGKPEYECGEGFPIKITCIYDGLAQYDDMLPDGTINTIEVADYELSGIPITPEILENNGFTYVGKKVWQWEEKPFWVWWEEETHHLGIEIDNSSYDEEKSKTIMIIVQNYVHELQHALRLCGIEKEIEL